MLHEKLCHTQTDGNVAVVGAGVHDAGRQRGKALVMRNVPLLPAFVYPQRINIKAQSDGGTLAAAKDGDNARKPAPGPGKKELVRSVFLRPAVMLLHPFLSGKPHTCPGKGDLPAQQQLLIAHVFQLPGNAGGGAHFQPAGLCIAVEFPPQRTQLASQLLRILFDEINHFSAPSCLMLC